MYIVCVWERFGEKVNLRTRTYNIHAREFDHHSNFISTVQSNSISGQTQNHEWVYIVPYNIHNFPNWMRVSLVNKPLTKTMIVLIVRKHYPYNVFMHWNVHRSVRLCTKSMDKQTSHSEPKSESKSLLSKFYYIRTKKSHTKDIVIEGHSFVLNTQCKHYTTKQQTSIEWDSQATQFVLLWL